jgi:hypothetical protein
VNRKKTQRLYREEGLTVRKRSGKVHTVMIPDVRKDTLLPIIRQKMQARRGAGRPVQPVGWSSRSPIASEAPEQGPISQLEEMSALIQLAKLDSDCFILDFKISGRPPKYNTSALGLS